MGKGNYKLLAWGAVALLLLVIVLYVFEFDHIGNTIKAGKLIWLSLIISLIIGVYLGQRFQHKGNEQVDKIRIWSVCVLMPLFFAPLLGSLSNRLLAGSEVQYKTFEFMEERAFAASAYGFLEGETIEPDGCYLFVYYEGLIHRLKRKRCAFSEKQLGDEIKLPVRKGLWGFEIVSLD